MNQLIGGNRPILSEHQDVLKERKQTYGGEEFRPEDYLESFNQFIKNNLNELVAIKAAVTRPRDLTREQLKELRILLDSNGFSESALKAAISAQSNQTIAAGIVAHIRRAALGESLVPFSQRVEKAMAKINAKHNWTKPQQRWLERLQKQLVNEVVIDKDTLNQFFARDGGVKLVDKVFDHQLEQVIEELKDAMWDDGNAA